MHLANAIDDYRARDWQTTEDGTVRFALVGLGWWAVDVVLPTLEDSDRCAATVLVSGSGEKAGSLADEYGAEWGLTYDEFHEGEGDGEYDAVYVSTPNGTHLEFVETAASLRKDVLCEKPLEATVERGERLVEAAESTGITLMTAYRMQTDPAVRRARELVEAGTIGEPVQAHGANSQPLLSMIPDPDQWRLDPEMTGYGTSVMDLGIYPINTARFVLDQSPVTTTAEMTSPSPEFEAVPDEYASFTLEFEDGCSLVCTTSQNAVKDSQLTILGTEGGLELDPAFHGEARLRVWTDEVEATIDRLEFDVEDQMREEFDYFADRVLAGEEVHPTGRHGLEDLRTIEAIHEAAERGGTVEI